MHKALVLFFPLFFFSSLKAASQQRLAAVQDTLPAALSLRIVPQNFYKQCLPLSCKTEMQLQKITSLPVYFRLGSKDYVDYLEKKPNAVKTQ